VNICYYPGSMKYRTTRESFENSAFADATHVAVVGMGYVGLPTALSLHEAGFQVSGVDINEDRLAAIRDCRVDAASVDLKILNHAISGKRFGLSADSTVLSDADVVIIAVPTPVDEAHSPDMRALESACESYVSAARAGQTVVLTSTTYVGCTNALLTDPLQLAGFEIGKDIHVAFSPERLNPGSVSFSQTDVPRVIGGVTPQCTEAAAAVLGSIASEIHPVSSPNVAEMTKLVENTFRAVNIALANEFAEAASAFSLDVREVLDASASKPYGFMSFRPGPGVGGHCIPCDPHYLLWGLHSERVYSPVVEQAMVSISSRPLRVVERVQEVLKDSGKSLSGARIVLVGMSYKPGVQDVRESPSIDIATLLRRRGAVLTAFDLWLEDELQDGDGKIIEMKTPTTGSEVDLAVVLTDQSGFDLPWLEEMDLVLDASFALEPSKTVVSL
jgi:UDP-N-acetyl-D-glucosamine dehydrogenase